jgi:hypothetical protein
VKSTLKQIAASTIAVAATIALAPSDASAFATVFIPSTNKTYKVESFQGNSLLTNPAFNSTLMPWLGNRSLAEEFAGAVKFDGNLGTNLNILAGNIEVGPLFAISRTVVPFVGLFTTSTFYGKFFPLEGVTPIPLPLRSRNSYIYATATELPPAAQVPGPLPILGAAAAFGFSRRLRTRIRIRSTNTTA